MTHSFATRAVLINVELALRARGRGRATPRVDLEFVSGKDLGVLNVFDGNFRISVVYTGIEVKIWLLAPRLRRGQKKQADSKATYYPCRIFPKRDGRS
jgi:hypothetical protein